MASTEEDEVMVTLKFDKLVTFGSKLDSSLDEIKKRWAEKTDHNPEEYVLKKEDRILSGAEKLSDIVDPKDFTIGLKVERYSSVSVRLLGMPDFQRSVRYCSVDTVAQVIEQVCECAEIRERCPQETRLLRGDESLCPDRRLMSYELQEDTKLDLDLQLNVMLRTQAALEFEDPLTDAQGEFLLDEDGQLPFSPIVTPDRDLHIFSSSQLLPFLPAPVPPNCRLLSHNRRLPSPSHTLSTILQLSHNLPDSSGVWPITMELSVCVLLRRLYKGREEVEERSLWPSEDLSNLRGRPSETVWWGGERVDGKTVKEAGIQEGALLRAGEIAWRSVEVRGRCLPLSFCDVDVVEEFEMRLTARMEEMERHLFHQFHLECRGRRLGSGERLCAVVGAQETVQVVEDVVEVTLLCEDVQTTLGAIRIGATFQHVLGLAAETLQMELALDSVFECQCGRRLSLENEWRATVPRSCCDGVEKTWTLHRPVHLSVRLHSSSSFLRLPSSSLLPPPPKHSLRIDDVPLDPALPLHQSASVCGHDYVRLRLETDLPLRLTLPGGKQRQWSARRDETVAQAMSRMQAEGVGHRLVRMEVKYGESRVEMHARRTFRQLGTPDLAEVMLVQDELPLSELLRKYESVGQDSDEDSIDISALKEEKKPRVPPTPRAPVTWHFNVDCRQAGGRRDFHIEMRGHPPDLDVAEIRQKLFNELGRRDIVLHIRLGRDADGHEMVETMDGWMNASGREAFLSDLVDLEWTELRDGARLPLPEERAVCLRVIRENQRDDFAPDML